MLEIINNTILNKNISSSDHKNSDFFNVIYNPDSFTSFFNMLSQYLLNKEIEFDNVSIKEKKDDDKSTIYTNFIINNLLNIFNKKDIYINIFNTKENNLQKKTSKYKNFLLEKNFFLKQQNHLSIKEIKEKCNTSDKKIFSDKLFKNIKFLNDLNKTNEIKNSNLVQLNNKNFPKKNKFISLMKDNTKIIKNEKNMIFMRNIKNSNDSLYLSKNKNNIDSLINETNLFKNINKKDKIKNNMEPLLFKSSQNSIEWQKLISQKILLSIANKINEVVIHLQPEYLGTLRVIINMKDDKARLKFISNNSQVRTFLDKYIPVLRHSLIQNGIKLEKFNISGSFNDKNLFYKNIFDLNKFKTFLHQCNKTIKNSLIKEHI